MMRVFLDTNIFIDYLSRREPFFEPAALLFQLGQRQKCQLMVASLSFATASFILQAHYKKSHSIVVELFSKIVSLCHITTVDGKTINEAISSDFRDFEDAMQYFSALHDAADVIITRNKQDFTDNKIPIFEPIEFINHYSEAQSQQ